MKIYLYKNGAVVAVEHTAHNGMYTVLLRAPSGAVHDKIRCDSYREAMEYKRAFCKIARNL